MKNLILREDLPFVLLLGLFLICISSANTFLQITGDSLFIANIGVSNLPLMYIISAVVLAIMAIGIIPVIDRMDRVKIYNITAGLLASELLLCWGLIILNVRWIYYPIYVTTYILETFLFLEFWLIAGDMCHTRQAKRIFPILLGGSLIAGVVTAFLVKILAPLIEIRNMLLLSSLLCWTTIPISQYLSKFSKKTSFTKYENRHKDISLLDRLSLDLKIIWQSKLVRILSFSFILYTVLSFILDFEFNQAASLHFTVGGKVVTQRLAGFYGLVTGWSVLCAIFLQFVLTRRLISRLGVCNTYLVMPFIFFFGFIGISLAKIFQGMAIYLLYAATSARFSHKIVAGSLQRSSGELLYHAIPNEKRGRVRAFHSAIVEPLGVALAGGLIILAQQFSLALAVFFCLIYIAIVGLSLRKDYMAGIIEMLKEKSGRLWESMSGTFGQYGTKEVLGVLQNTLRDRDPDIRIFAYEIIAQTKDKKACSIFETALNDNDLRIKKVAIESLGNIGTRKTLNIIKPFLNNKNFRIQAQAIAACWRLGGEKGHLKKLMEELFKNEDIKARLAAIELAGNIPLPESLNYLLHSLSSKLLRIAAIKALGKTGEEKAAGSLIKLLERRDNRLSFLISAALASMGKIALEPIRGSLVNGDIYSRHFLLKAMEGIGLTGGAVSKGMEKNALVGHKTLKELIPRDIRESYYYNFLIAKLSTLKNKRATVLVEDALLEENNKAQSNALTSIKLLDDNSERMNIVSRNIRHPDAFVRSNALEALENIGAPNLVRPLIGLLEGRSPEEEFSDLTTSQVLEELLTSSHRWLRATVIFSVGELKFMEFKDRLVDFLEDKDSFIRANALEALKKMGYRFPPNLLQSLKADPSPLVRKYANTLSIGQNAI